MKKPDIKSLDGLTPDDAFTQTAQAESDKGQKAAKKNLFSTAKGYGSVA